MAGVWKGFHWSSVSCILVYICECHAKVITMTHLTFFVKPVTTSTEGVHEKPCVYPQNGWMWNMETDKNINFWTTFIICILDKTAIRSTVKERMNGKHDLRWKSKYLLSLRKYFNFHFDYIVSYYNTFLVWRTTCRSVYGNQYMRKLKYATDISAYCTVFDFASPWIMKGFSWIY